MLCLLQSSCSVFHPRAASVEAGSAPRPVIERPCYGCRLFGTISPSNLVRPVITRWRTLGVWPKLKNAGGLFARRCFTSLLEKQRAPDRCGGARGLPESRAFPPRGSLGEDEFVPEQPPPARRRRWSPSLGEAARLSGTRVVGGHRPPAGEGLRGEEAFCFRGCIPKKASASLPSSSCLRPARASQSSRAGGSGFWCCWRKPPGPCTVSSLCKVSVPRAWGKRWPRGLVCCDPSRSEGAELRLGIKAEGLLLEAKYCNNSGSELALSGMEEAWLRSGAVPAPGAERG